MGVFCLLWGEPGVRLVLGFGFFCELGTETQTRYVGRLSHGVPRSIQHAKESVLGTVLSRAMSRASDPAWIQA
jgi:hypothetical protein